MKKADGTEVVETVENPAPQAPQGGEPHIGGGQTLVLNNSGDITKLLEKVRTEEKNKLYPQLEELKQENVKLRKELSEMGEKISRLPPSPAQANPDKVDALMKTVEDMKAENVVLRQRLDATTDLARQEITNLRLSRYREKKLAEAGPCIIPELVTGNTETEIDAAVMTSKARFAELMKVSVEEAKHTSRQAGQEANMPPVSGQPPMAPHEAQSAESITEADLRNMSPKEYAAHRLKLRKEANEQASAFFRGQR